MKKMHDVNPIKTIVPLPAAHTKKEIYNFWLDIYSLALWWCKKAEAEM